MNCPPVMSKDASFDFWYAVSHTHVVVPPRSRLETFGNTVVNYHLVAELMDSVDKVRVREGRIEAYKPQILTPDHFADSLLDGFGDDAAEYVEWLRSNRQVPAIIQYGFAMRKQETNQHVVSDTLEVVTDRVQKELAEGDDPLAALLVGVDEPWEVCLVKLMVDLVGVAAPHHAIELGQDPQGHRHEVERVFTEAARDASRVHALGTLLEKTGLFEEYQDRFFALVRAHRSSP